MCGSFSTYTVRRGALGKLNWTVKLNKEPRTGQPSEPEELRGYFNGLTALINRKRKARNRKWMWSVEKGSGVQKEETGYIDSWTGRSLVLAGREHDLTSWPHATDWSLAVVTGRDSIPWGKLLKEFWFVYIVNKLTSHQGDWLTWHLQHLQRGQKTGVCCSIQFRLTDYPTAPHFRWGLQVPALTSA